MSYNQGGGFQQRGSGGGGNGAYSNSRFNEAQFRDHSGGGGGGGERKRKSAGEQSGWTPHQEYDRQQQQRQQPPPLQAHPQSIQGVAPMAPGPMQLPPPPNPYRKFITLGPRQHNLQGPPMPVYAPPQSIPQAATNAIAAAASSNMQRGGPKSAGAGSRNRLKNQEASTICHSFVKRHGRGNCQGDGRPPMKSTSSQNQPPQGSRIQVTDLGPLRNISL